MMLVLLVATILGCTNSYKIDPCVGCLDTLFQTSNTALVGDQKIPLQLDPSDAGKLVISQIDDIYLKEVLEETIPATSNIDEIYSAPMLDYDLVIEDLSLCVRKVFQELVPSPTFSTTEQIIERMMTEISTMKLNKMIKERNQNLVERREMVLNQYVHSMINDMWTTTSNKIRDVPLDTHNVSKSLYRQMLKELLPELTKSTNYSSVQKTLMYPVITDELNLIIRKSNDTGTVHELTDKMFDKLTPFIREGLLMDLSPLDTTNLKKDAAKYVKDTFGPSLEKSTQEALIIAGKTQMILNEEMKDHKISTEFMEMVKPYLSEGVQVGMAWLKARGLSYKGRFNPIFIARYILSAFRWSTSKDLGQQFSKMAFAKKFEILTKDKKSYPEDIEVINKYMMYVITPKMHEFMIQEIDEFRRQNPQLDKCGASIIAATVYGSMKMEIISLTETYIEPMTEIEGQAAVDHVLDQLKESLPMKIEAEAEDQGDYESGKFMQSDTFKDVKLQLESRIYSLVMKTLSKN